MAQPLKNVFSEAFVRELAHACDNQYSDFVPEAFIAECLQEWTALELKQRMRRISQSLGVFLPDKFDKAIEILLPVSQQFDGLAHIVFPDFIEVFGLEHWSASMSALGEMTCRSSSEFAIRPFIIKYPQKTMRQMHLWSQDDNDHRRRLASEGCRPRLPWAMALPEFKQDPRPVLQIIEPMLADDSLYVRRSVANNLNDISKDNPQPVRELTKRYLGRGKLGNWTLKHANRGLLKSGDPRVMEMFGYAPAGHIEINQFKLSPTVSKNGELQFSFEATTKDERALGKLRWEFAIGFNKANGKMSPKVFKIAEADYSSNHKSFSKQFSFKPITTRKYYPGKHSLSLLLNGKKVATGEFELLA